MIASELHAASAPRKRRWFQFSLRTLLFFQILASVGLSWSANKMTFPWEVTWVKRATSLALHNPEETLAGTNLQKFLAGFERDNQGHMGMTCTMSLRRGYIGIDDQTYPVEFVRDKFRGDVLVVHCRWKTVEVARRPWGKDVAW